MPRRLRRDLLGAELRRRLELNPLQWIRRPDGAIVPLRPTPIQALAFERQRGRKVFGLVGGNRLGKSLWASMRCAESLLDVPHDAWPRRARDPGEWRLGPPRTLWCVTLSFEKSRDGQQQFLWERIPRCLWRSAWNPKTGFHNNVGLLVNGSRLHFKTCEQGLRTFETAAVDGVWIDETVPSAFFTALLPRLVDRRGWLIWTTIFDDPFVEDLFVRRRLDPGVQRELPEDAIDHVGGTMYDNPHLPVEEIRLLERTLPESERLVRVAGRPAYRQGLVYPEWDERLHLEAFAPPVPDEWDLYEAIDPGWDNPCAVLFVGVDRLGVHHCYDEIYVRRHAVSEVAALIHLRRWTMRGLMSPAQIDEYHRLTQAREREDYAERAQADEQLADVIRNFTARYGACAPRRTLIDEAAAQRDQAKTVSALIQFRRYGIHAAPASNRDTAGLERGLRELLTPAAGRVRWRVAEQLAWTRFEFAHYRTGRRDEVTGEYLDDREKRVRAHNHLISCAEYIAALRLHWSGRGTAHDPWLADDPAPRDWRRRG